MFKIISYYRLYFSIYDGVTCTDYKRINHTYGECIENALEKKMLVWYGCIPPWFPTTNVVI